jgi:CubicO group peptidase (beta-lactamase class C family)
MERKGRKGARAILAALVIILIAGAYYINSLIPIITGYAAKNLASGVFVSHRTQADMESNDLNFSFIAKTKNELDYSDMKVTSRFLWGKSVAVYRDRFGVTLLRDIDVEDLMAVTFPQDVVPTYSRDTIPWPLGDIMPEPEERSKYNQLSALAEDIVLNDPYGGNAYALMILHKGVPVAEVYEERFDKDTRFLSWSMAKSIMNGLLGVQKVIDEEFDIYAPVTISDWDEENSSSGITWNNLMQMQSGLSWNEDYGNRSDVTVMLHEENDFASYAYNKKPEFEPGTSWLYSSGTTNIVSSLFRSMFENDGDYYAFPHKELFYKIGITDAIFETDPSGTIVASSYLYMTARDYARFALLYQQDGVFAGKRILPEGWVDYSVAESSASQGGYGSFFWLNRGREVPSAPEDMYMCVGHDGQKIYIIPSMEMVIVLLGYSPSGSMDFTQLLGDILETVPS